MGRCGSLGSLQSPLSRASQLSGASVLHFSHPEFLNAHCREWLQPECCEREQVFSFPSALAAAAAKSLQSCPTLRPQRRQPTRLPRPLDSPGWNTGVGCHFLLQCMKVKSESEVAQLCPTLSDPMACSPPGSPAHGIFQARVLEWGAIAFSETVSLDFCNFR